MHGRKNIKNKINSKVTFPYSNISGATKDGEYKNVSLLSFARS